MRQGRALRRWFISVVCLSFLLFSLYFLFQWAGLDSGSLMCRKLAPVLGAHAINTIVVQFMGGSLLGTIVGFAGKAIFGFLAGEADLSKAMLPGESSSGTRLALPSSSSSWTEDSLELRVLEEPFPDNNEPGNEGLHPVKPNRSLETSLHQRLKAFGNEESPFLMGKKNAEYFSEVQQSLRAASDQTEYNRILDFENRDLQIRELKHSCFSIFQQVLSQQPTLAEKAAYNPQEAFIDFFNEKRGELDTHLEWSSTERDRKELQFLDRVRQDIRKHGSYSIYMGQILGYAAHE